MKLRKTIRLLHVYATTTLLVVLLGFSSANVVDINRNNIDTVLKSTELVFINFYADWCRFSQILTPIFQQAAENVKKEFPQEGKVVFGKVDCDEQNDIAAKYHISKYPTLKLVRNGEMLKMEYRGQRESTAIAEFIRGQLKEVIQEASDFSALDELQDEHRRIIGYFENKESASFNNFRKVAGNLRDSCQFHIAVGPISQHMRAIGDTVIYRPPHTRMEDVTYVGDLHNVDQLNQWILDKCVPLVREITFENAEELTEEGIPFLILFHKPGDRDTVDTFTKEVAKQLLTERTNVNFLTADGFKFSHPLHHLGKGPDDLPLLAIDSFRHMYLFPHKIEDITKPGLLRQFILDLHSGKLHREFHHGPDPVSSSPPPPKDAQIQDEGGSKEPGDELTKTGATQDKEATTKQTSPPESVFKKLKPTNNRYTILRDEL